MTLQYIGIYIQYKGADNMKDLKHYTISQFSQIIGYKPYVIRFYEKEFEIKIPRTKSNHRYFTQREIDIFMYIKNLQNQGFSNAQIKIILKAPYMSAQIANSISDMAATKQICSNLDNVQNPLFYSTKFDIIRFIQFIQNYCIKGVTNMDIQKKYDEINGIWEVCLTGEIDIYNAPQLKESLISMLNQKNASIVLDCEKLRYIDSTGLGVLISILKRVKDFGGDIRIKNLKPYIAKIFTITGLDKIFAIEE